MSKTAYLLINVTLLLGLAACGDASKPMQELTGSAMGTSFSVKLVEPPAESEMQTLKREIEATLGLIERSMSTYIKDSELSRFNASPGTDWYEVSAELCAVIEEAQAIAEISNGAFDVTVGPLVNLWGFGPDGDVTTPPAAEQIVDAMQSTGLDRLHADCTLPAIRKDVSGLYVDLSAIAKGYAVDELAELLEAHDLANYLVEIGGELRARGTNAKGEHWAIAIETPVRSARAVQTIVGLDNAAMATSGDYRNYFVHAGTLYSHTIDPRTGRPVTHEAASVTVVADTATFADGIATALLVLGPADGLELAEREDIAAYFLLRIGSEIDTRMTTLFANEVYRQ